MEVSLDDVGCCAGDYEIFDWIAEFLTEAWRDPSRQLDHYVRNLPFDNEGGWLFIVQRLEQWVASGALGRVALQAILDQVQTRGLHLATAARCIPEAGDWFVLREWEGVPAGLVACAIVLGESLQQTTKRLIKYAAFNVRPSSFNEAEAGFVPQPDDAILLSRDANRKPPWLEHEPDLVDMLKAARALGCTVESIVPRYRRYEFLGIRSPRLSHQALEAVLPKDEADRLLLAGVVYDDQGRRQITFLSLLRTAVRTHRPLGTLFDRVREFREVGVTSAPLDFVPIADYQPVEEDVRALEDMLAPERILALGPLLAAVIGRRLRLEVTRRLGALPAICSDQVIAALRIDELDVCVLSLDGDGDGPWISRKVPRSHIAVVAKKQKCDEQDLVERVKRMAPLGVELIEGGTLQVL